MPREFSYNYVNGPITGITTSAATQQTQMLVSPVYGPNNSVITPGTYGVGVSTYLYAWSLLAPAFFNVESDRTYNVTCKMEFNGKVFTNSNLNTETTVSLSAQTSGTFDAHQGQNSVYFASIFGTNWSNNNLTPYMDSYISAIKTLKYTFTLSDSKFTNATLSQKVVYIHDYDGNGYLNLNSSGATFERLVRVNLGTNSVAQEKILIPNAASAATFYGRLASNPSSASTWSTFKMIPKELLNYTKYTLNNDGRTYSSSANIFYAPSIYNVAANQVVESQYNKIPDDIKEGIKSALTVTLAANTSQATASVANMHSMVYTLQPEYPGKSFYDTTACTGTRASFFAPASATTFSRWTGPIPATTGRTLYTKSETEKHVIYIRFVEGDSTLNVNHTEQTISGITKTVTYPSSLNTFSTNVVSSGIAKISLSFRGYSLITPTTTATGGTVTCGSYTVEWKQTSSISGDVIMVTINNGPSEALDDNDFSLSVQLSDSNMAAPQDIPYSKYYSVGGANKFEYNNYAETVNSTYTITKVISIPLFETAHIIDNEGVSHAKISNYIDFSHKFASHYAPAINEKYNIHPNGICSLLTGSTPGYLASVINANNKNRCVGANAWVDTSSIDNNTLIDILGRKFNSSITLSSHPSYVSIYPNSMDTNKQVPICKLFADEEKPVVTIEYLGYSIIGINIKGSVSEAYIEGQRVIDGESIIVNIPAVIGSSTFDFSQEDWYIPGHQYAIDVVAINNFGRSTSNEISFTDNLLFNAPLKNGIFTDLVSNTNPVTAGTMVINSYNLRTTITGSSYSRVAALKYSSSALKTALSTIPGGDYTILINSSQVSYAGNKYSPHMACNDLREVYSGTNTTSTTTRLTSYPAANISQARYGTSTGEKMMTSGSTKAMYVAPSQSGKGGKNYWYYTSGGTVHSGSTSGTTNNITSWNEGYASTDTWYATSNPLPPSSVTICQLNSNNTSLSMYSRDARILLGKPTADEIIGGPKNNEIWYKKVSDSANVTVIANGVSPIYDVYVAKLGVNVAFFNGAVTTFNIIDSSPYQSVKELYLPKTITGFSGVVIFEALKSGSNVYTYKDSVYNLLEEEPTSYGYSDFSISFNIVNYDNRIKSAGSCCFASGTPIMVDLSGRTKNIEEIEVGDEVVSYNRESMEPYIAIVKKVIIKHDVQIMLEVTTQSGRSIIMRPYHPLLTTEGWRSYTNFNAYDMLCIGDRLVTIDGEDEIVNLHEFFIDEPIDVYNLDVVDVGEDPDDDTNDSFYANGIVAHNSDC